MFCVPVQAALRPATLCLQPGKQVAQAEMERATFVVAVVVVVFRIVYKVQMQRLNENECTFDAKLRLMEMQTVRTALVGHLRISA